MRRTLVLFVTLVVLWAIVAQLNHALTDLRVYLTVSSLFVVYAALTQPLRSGLAATLLGGLLCDAHMPIAPELPPLTFSLAHVHLLLFAAAHATLYHIRDRVPRDDTTSRVVIAVLANLALFLVFSPIEMSVHSTPSSAWPRLLHDLVWSQVFLAVIAPWFFALQTHALALAHVPQEQHA
ncbi:MAG TPA: hypothetical protein VHD62_10620 [Opitutaceae bacterium]|nr:hypothetical protein [Opitutaceae bacterium]